MGRSGRRLEAQQAPDCRTGALERPYLPVGLESEFLGLVRRAPGGGNRRSGVCSGGKLADRRSLSACRARTGDVRIHARLAGRGCAELCRGGSGGAALGLAGGLLHRRHSGSAACRRLDVSDGAIEREVGGRLSRIGAPPRFSGQAHPLHSDDAVDHRLGAPAQLHHVCAYVFSAVLPGAPSPGDTTDRRAGFGPGDRDRWCGWNACRRVAGGSGAGDAARRPHVAGR